MYESRLGRNIEGNLRKIESCIKNEFNISCTIEVTKFRDNNMVVYPSREELQKMSGRIIPKGLAHSTDKPVNIETAESLKLERCNDVFIQIGNELVNGKAFPGLNVTGRMLTAILLHEIGHKVTSDQFYNELAEKITKLQTAFFASNLVGVIGLGLLGVSLKAIIIIGIVKFFADSRIIKSKVEEFKFKRYESLSDSLAVRYGYGKELYEFLDYIHKKVENKDLVTSIFTKLFGKNQLQYRKDEIIRVLEDELKSDKNDEYQKKIIREQLNEIWKMKNSLKEEVEMSKNKNVEGLLLESTVETDLFVDQHVEALSKKDCRYLLTKEGVRDIIYGEYEPILQTLEIEIKSAVDLQDYIMLGTIQDNLEKTRERLKKWIKEGKFTEIPMAHKNMAKFIRHIEFLLNYHVKRWTQDTVFIDPMVF